MSGERLETLNKEILRMREELKETMKAQTQMNKVEQLSDKNPSQINKAVLQMASGGVQPPSKLRRILKYVLPLVAGSLVAGAGYKYIRNRRDQQKKKNRQEELARKSPGIIQKVLDPFKVMRKKIKKRNPKPFAERGKEAFDFLLNPYEVESDEGWEQSYKEAKKNFKPIKQYGSAQDWLKDNPQLVYK